jgi:thiol-disulfide isomerase/thioredoxin
MNGAKLLRSSPRLRAALELAALVALVSLALGIYRAATEEKPALDERFMQVASVPRPLPELIFEDANGKALALTDFSRKLVLLNVWATWCTPCRKEMPALDRLQQQLGGPGFEVVALSIDRGGAAAVQAFYEELDIRALSVYVDRTSEAASKLGAIGIPTTVLVDRQGRELWRKVGPAEWDGTEALELLRRYIGGDPSG